MKMRNYEGKIALLTLLILSMVLSAAVSWAQTTAEEESTLTEDYQRGEEMVENFCQLWRNNDYTAMYQYLSQAAKQRQSEGEFIKKYQVYKLAAGPLIQRPIFPLSMVEEGRMLIRVEVESEETFTMEERITKEVELGLIMNEEKTWKIERIHIPIPLLTP